MYRLRKKGSVMEESPQGGEVCVVCALPEEVRAFLEMIKPYSERPLEEHISPRYGYSYRSATLKNKKDELLHLHISWLPRYGPQEMTLHLERVLSECQPRIAVMTGICAGDSRQVQLGDLVVAERTFTYNNGKYTFDEQGRSVHLHDAMTYQLDVNILQFLGLFDEWKSLVASLPYPASVREQHEVVCHLKAMASGSAVRADHPFAEVQVPVRGTVAIDMEGAAFGLVMSRYPTVRWLVVKGVCDYADQEKDDTYHEYAAQASALYALSFIRAYVSDERLPRQEKPSPASQSSQSGKASRSARFGAPFPEVWNVFRRHTPFFTGRSQVLEQLFEGFRSEDEAETIFPQALTGLGGMGKTQTAAEYAYRFRREYRAVLWIRAETQESLLSDFRAIAGMLKVPQEHLRDRTSVLQTMRGWFRNQSDWLLILDNADNPALVDPFLPRAARGHVLVTTRAGAMVTQAQPLPLQPLSPEDGALCLLRRAGILAWNKSLPDAPIASVDAARQVAQLMEGLPLALEQAGAYINDTECGVKRYLKLYEQYRSEIQRLRHGVVPDYPASVASAWSISRSTVEQNNPAAAELLRLCAFLAPEGIPDELLTKGALALGPILGPVAANPVTLDQALGLLRKYSLLHREADRETDLTRLSIHQVLQEILLDEMDESTQRLWAERVVRALAQALPGMSWLVFQAHVRNGLRLVKRWNMTFFEAERLKRQVEEAERREEA
jgi:nucleoside phosphorylase